MTVKITAFSGGEEGILYFTRGDGCGHHDHLRGEHGVGPEQYFLDGQEGNPVGVWYGAGLRHLGFEEGSTVAEWDARAVFGRVAHPGDFTAAREAIDAHAEAEGLEPDEVEALYAEAAAAARLGSKPYRYKSLEERVAARVKAERKKAEKAGGELLPERVAEIELEEAGKKQSKPRNFYDVTFSPSKSSSAYYAGLLTSGREAEAELMRQIHRESVTEALEFFQREAGVARAGHHGKAPAGRATVGRWVDAQEWVMSLWDHQTNREGEPQLHTHGLVLNRVLTTDADGKTKWRALDGASLYKAQRGAAAIYERGFEQRMEHHFAVAYRMRPDGKARELIGISEEERAALSTRSAQISEKVAAWAAEYEAMHGQAPGPYARTLMEQQAAQATRKPKEHIASMSELLRSWDRMVGQRLQTSLSAIVERAESGAVEARAAGDAERWERHVVIRQAIERVQAQRSEWSRSELMFAINDVLPDRLGPSVLAQRGYTTALLEDLADEALSGRYGTVMVQGLELIASPEELRRADGRSVYQAARDERYATLTHLHDEQWVIARAQQRGALALTQDAIADVLEDAAQGGRPLSDDQTDVVAGVLGDGRLIDVVRGPAGAGKSVAQGTIARAWEVTGRRVIGLGPSSKAAQVLRAEGLRVTTNTARFLERAKGKGPRHEVELYKLRSGDMVILDEAGMATTQDIVAIARMVADVGGKLVLCGDDAQLAAVGAGGLFRELVNLGVAVELGTVRRFRDANGNVRGWEARASLGLRDGQVHALRDYLARGRIDSGTAEEMAEAIRRQYVTDQLRGVYSVIMTGTEEEAATLSGGIRADLVALGQVEADGVQLADGNLASVGDLIQARENVNNLRDSAGMPVFNRFVYRVVERGGGGSLTVERVVGRDEDGREQLRGRVKLKASYLAQNVTLAYAGTVHSIQGDTVQAGYALVTSAMAREQLYVAMTRGWQENRAFVALERDEEVLPVLAQVLDNAQGQRSASETLRTELEWIGSIGAHAPIWEDLVSQHQHTKARDILREELGEQLLERLEAEDASTVYRQIWAAELDGHDPRALVAEAVGDACEGGLGNAEVLPKLVHWRIGQRLVRRAPEQQAAGHSWVERTPADMAGPAGEWAREHAAVMDARVDALGERAVQAPPAWAVERLGPVPVDPVQRADWQQRVAKVEAYREQYQVEATSTVIGPPPGKSMVTQWAAWEAAHAALGRTAEEQRLAEAKTATLRERLEIWQREQEWAPPSVAEELARVAEQRRAHEQAEALLRAQAEMEADPAQRVQLLERARAEEVEVQRLVGYGAAVEERHAKREAWYDRTAALREQAEAALAELIRRRADVPEVERDAERERRTEAAQERQAQQEPETPEWDRQREVFRRLLERWESGEPVAEAEREQQAERELVEDRGPEAFRQLVERWESGEPIAEAEREQQAERELVEDRGPEAFRQLVEQWDARERAELERQAQETEHEHQADREQAPEVTAEELRERVLEELREAQERTVQSEQASVRERTERAEPGREAEAEKAPSLREQIEAQLAERQAAQEAEAERAQVREVEIVPERSMDEINRDHHYAQVAEQEAARVIEAQRDAPSIER